MEKIKEHNIPDLELVRRGGWNNVCLHANLYDCKEAKNPETFKYECSLSCDRYQDCKHNPFNHKK